MKKLIFFITFLVITVSIFAAETNNAGNSNTENQSEQTQKILTEIPKPNIDPIAVKPDFGTSDSETPEIDASNTDEQAETPTKAKISFPTHKIVFDEGVSFCQLTRIEQIPNRSNFVRENMMIGPFMNVQTVDLSFFDLIINVSAYYPFYQAFNGMPQKPRNMFNYAINGFFGTVITLEKLKVIKFDFMLGMHYMYQLTDEFYMHYVGLGGCAGFELPVTKNLSIINNNFVSYDNANLGSNKNIQLFTGSYQYQINLGLRYSKKSLSKYYYIDTSKAEARKQQRKENRKAYKKTVEELK